MNTPTKEQRDKINEAIDKVTNLCASGNTTPSKAVAKVASAMHLTDDYLPIIVRAYNTGAATIHRENSHSLQEKVASYPIANLDEVRSILQKEFPLNKKAAVEAPRDTFWEYNANYHFPNAWAHLEVGLDPEFWDVKQASVKQCTAARDRVRSNVASTAERAATEATRIKYAAVEELNQAVADLESILCKTAGITLDTARDYASAVYGDTGLSVINKLIQFNNLEKTAKYRKETYIPTTHPFAKAFDKFVLKNEQVKKASKEEKEVVTQCLNTVNELVRPKDRYVEDSDFIDAMLKEGEMCRRKKDLCKHYEKKKEDFLKEAYRPLSESGVGRISGLEQLNHPGWVGLDRFERELMYGLADPAHEAKLRNIRVQTILTDLMNTDPYLKDKDPEEVIDAMNDIMEINPDIHKNKPMLRLALRQYMESGGMDIPTLGVISEFGKEERERKSRERSQAESAAAQFASQQESARQADEKLRSEEERARADRESREQIAAKELELKEREFAKKYPELEEKHKGLVRRLVSMGMSVRDIAHNIRHPLQATSEAFTREWNRERRDRDIKGQEEDADLNSREADILGAANRLAENTLRNDELTADMGRRDEIRNRKEVRDYIEGVNLDKAQRKAVIDQLYAKDDERSYAQQKVIDNATTFQDLLDLSDNLSTKHNKAQSGRLNSEIDLEDAIHNNDPGQKARRQTNRSKREAIEDKSLDQQFNDLDTKLRTEHNNTITNAINSYINSEEAKERAAKVDELVSNYRESLKQQIEDDKQKNMQAPNQRMMDQRAFENKLWQSNYDESKKTQNQTAYKNQEEARRRQAATNRYNAEQAEYAAHQQYQQFKKPEYKDAIKTKAWEDARAFREANTQEAANQRLDALNLKRQEDAAATIRGAQSLQMRDKTEAAKIMNSYKTQLDKWQQLPGNQGKEPPTSIADDPMNWTLQNP